MIISRAELDLELGLKYYSSSSEGIGGRIRSVPEDFVVIEVNELGELAFPYASPPREGSGNFTWFILEKRKVDSITALKLVAKALGVSHKKFSVAGLKDARALTYQFACAEGVPPEDIVRVETPYVRVIAAFRMPFKLTPGMLFGNVFVIVVRDVSLSPSLVETRILKILKEIKANGGVPNYYGYQRFGTIRPNTHKIGRLIVKGMYKEAFEEAVLRVYPRESPWSKEAREYLAATGDLRGALKKFPPNLHHERTMIKYLARHPGDYVGAFRALPLSIRRLFIGAYQAYLFNRVLSRRIEHGLRIDRAYVGDIVAIYHKSGFKVRLRGILRVTDTNVSKINELIKRGQAHLVINVFGYRTKLAGGIQGEIEREILREEGISLADFMIKSIPEASSKGDVRRSCLNPLKLSFRVLKSSETLVEFSFLLTKGSYATVLLREFIKPKDIIAAGF